METMRDIVERFISEANAHIKITSEIKDTGESLEIKVERLLREKAELYGLITSSDYKSNILDGIENLSKFIGDKRGDYSNYEKIRNWMVNYSRSLHNRAWEIYRTDFK